MLKFITLTCILVFTLSLNVSGEAEVKDAFTIEGRVEVVSTTNKEWLTNTQVTVDGGVYIAHLRFAF